MMVAAAFGPDAEPGRPALEKLVEQARAEELAALSDAAALLRASAPQEQVEAAYRRCELARARKMELLARLGPGGA